MMKWNYVSDFEWPESYKVWIEKEFKKWNASVAFNGNTTTIEAHAVDSLCNAANFLGFAEGQHYNGR
jgi:hypothetical protein